MANMTNITDFNGTLPDLSGDLTPELEAALEVCNDLLAGTLLMGGNSASAASDFMACILENTAAPVPVPSPTEPPSSSASAPIVGALFTLFAVVSSVLGS